MINVQIYGLEGAEGADGATGEGKQERQGDCPTRLRPLKFLPERHADAKRDDLVEYPEVGSDDVSDLEAQCGMLRQPHVGATAEVACG
jgi:hypothetical protein